jgi:hypothetical protein
MDLSGVRIRMVTIRGITGRKRKKMFGKSTLTGNGLKRQLASTVSNSRYIFHSS